MKLTGGFALAVLFATVVAAPIPTDGRSPAANALSAITHGIKSSPITWHFNNHGIEQPTRHDVGDYNPAAADLATRDQVNANDGTRCLPPSQSLHGSLNQGHNPTPPTRPYDHAGGGGGGTQPATAALAAREKDYDPTVKPHHNEVNQGPTHHCPKGLHCGNEAEELVARNKKFDPSYGMHHNEGNEGPKHHCPQGHHCGDEADELVPRHEKFSQTFDPHHNEGSEGPKHHCPQGHHCGNEADD